MTKIEVKDYYAIKRGNARNTKLSKAERVKIAKKAINTRWENYRKELEEDKKYLKRITK